MCVKTERINRHLYPHNIQFPSLLSPSSLFPLLSFSRVQSIYTYPRIRGCRSYTPGRLFDGEWRRRAVVVVSTTRVRDRVRGRIRCWKLSVSDPRFRTRIYPREWARAAEGGTFSPRLAICLPPQRDPIPSATSTSTASSFLPLEKCFMNYENENIKNISSVSPHNTLNKKKEKSYNLIIYIRFSIA